MSIGLEKDFQFLHQHLADLLGELLREVLLEARSQGTLSKLPLQDPCQMVWYITMEPTGGRATKSVSRKAESAER